MIGVNDTRSEGNRRNMPLPRGARLRRLNFVPSISPCSQAADHTLSPIGSAVHNVRSQAEPAISHEDSLGGDYMHRSVYLIQMLSIIPVAALGQTTPTDSQTLQAILSEIRQLRHDLQTSNAMAARAQIALYRLQH